jgi:D-alanyl-D-alanine carboxypeptidase
MSRGAPSRLRHVAVLLPPLVAVALLLPGLAAVASAPVDGTATLAVSRPEIVYGGAIRLTGAVQSGEGCVSGRQVRLQGREPGQAGFTFLKKGTTAGDGSFGFWRRPEHTSDYRAFLPQVVTATATCNAVTSPILSSAVDAKVSLALSPNPLDAATCAKATVAVLPSKPGTRLRLQQEGPSGGWHSVTSVTLDSASQAAAPACYGWSSIGTAHLRALWPAQDPLNAPGTSPIAALDVVEAPWMRTIDSLTSAHAISVSVASGDRFLYEHGDRIPHAPASNEKLLLSMALLDAFGPTFRIGTVAAARSFDHGVVHGSLWILGRGDPEIGRTRIALLASRLVAAGLHRVEGSVMGGTGFFEHDWFAPGWKPEFPAEDVALPSALTFRRNQANGVHVGDPERRAAAALTRALEAKGVTVTKDPGAGTPPGGLHAIASFSSLPLAVPLRHQNLHSVNFIAEVLGKRLGVLRSGPPGTIAKGAAAIRSFTAAHGVAVTAYDSSGLSYWNRVTALGIVRLLGVADTSSWGPALKASLPRPGQGTLEDRLSGVPVEAKTGTLEDVSALSGWVRLERTGQWARFSILSWGFDESHAKDIEDAVVRTLWRYGR